MRPSFLVAALLAPLLPLASPTLVVFPRQAMDWISQRGVVHLVVDLPGIDNQHGVAPAFQALVQASAGSAGTLTSRTLLAKSLTDGLYMVSLNPSAMVHHTIPSTPLLYKLSPAAGSSSGQGSARGQPPQRASILALSMGPMSVAGQESLEEINAKEERARRTVPSYMSIDGRQEAHDTMQRRPDAAGGEHGSSGIHRKGAYPRGNASNDPRARVAAEPLGVGSVSSPAQRIRMGAAAVHRNLSGVGVGMGQVGGRLDEREHPPRWGPPRDMSIHTVSTATPTSPAQRYTSSRTTGTGGGFVPSMEAFEEGSPTREDIGIRLNSANFLM